MIGNKLFWEILCPMPNVFIKNVLKNTNLNWLYFFLICQFPNCTIFRHRTDYELGRERGQKTYTRWNSQICRRTSTKIKSNISLKAALNIILSHGSCIGDKWVKYQKKLSWKISNIQYPRRKKTHINISYLQTNSCEPQDI